MNAHTERAFTWRQLVRALHQRDCLPAWRTREVNRFAECGEGNGRENMEILTLPGPAGELWAAKREVIHSLPAEVFGQRLLDSPSANPSRVGRGAAADGRCGGQHPGLRHPPPKRRPSSPFPRLKRVAACG